MNIGSVNGNKSDESSSGGMVSFNHYANGAVGDWLYRRIAPIPGGNITSAKGSVKTPYGRLTSEWFTAGDKFTINLTVPVSTECELILPNGEKHTLLSGKHEYTCNIPEK